MKFGNKIRSSMVAKVLAVVLLHCCVGAGAADLTSRVDEARSNGEAALLAQLLLQRAESSLATGFLRDAEPDILEAVEIGSELDSASLRALSLSAQAELYATPVGNAALIGSWPNPEPLFKESIALAK